MADVTARGSATAAYVAAAVNLAAGLVMLLALRYGIPAGESDLSARIEYVREHTLTWRLGWLVWNLAAISLLGFFVALDFGALSLAVVGGMLVGGLLAAPLAAWLVRHLPSRVLGVAVSGVIILTNGPRALEAFGLPVPLEVAILVAAAAAWLVGLVLVMRRRSTAIQLGPDPGEGHAA